MGQWGFRGGRSTEGLLIHLTETWKQTLDNSRVVGAVYIDFQKAFDTVSYYFERQIRSHRSYLTNRKQFAIVNGCTHRLRMSVAECYKVPCLGQGSSPIMSIISLMNTFSSPNKG